MNWNDGNTSKCPKCGSKNFTDTVRMEQCHSCGYGFYYGDAHATGDAQLSKELYFGKPVEPKDEE